MRPNLYKYRKYFIIAFFLSAAAFIVLGKLWSGGSSEIDPWQLSTLMGIWLSGLVAITLYWLASIFLRPDHFPSAWIQIGSVAYIGAFWAFGMWILYMLTGTA